MRRLKLLASCVLLIIVAVPLLPGPGALIIAETLAVLEREFPSIRWAMDALDRLGRRNRSRQRPVGPEGTIGVAWPGGRRL